MGRLTHPLEKTTAGHESPAVAGKNACSTISTKSSSDEEV
jgi:hypothetical protein